MSQPQTTVRVPPGPRSPYAVQLAATLVRRRETLAKLHARYGDTFATVLPLLGRVVVANALADVRTLFRSGPDVVDVIDQNLGRMMGPGSLFAQRGEVHRTRRRLLTPSFTGGGWPPTSGSWSRRPRRSSPGGRWAWSSRSSRRPCGSP